MSTFSMYAQVSALVGKQFDLPDAAKARRLRGSFLLTLTATA